MNVEEYFPECISAIQHDDSSNEIKEIPRKFSPVLPIIEEVSLPRRSLPAIHCHVCYKNISGTVSKSDFFKPCKCPMTFVHNSCAAKNSHKFGEAKCSMCGQSNTLPRRAIGGRSKVETRVEPVENSKFCSHCENKKFQKPAFSDRCDAKLVKPCFCGMRLHFGCLKELIEQEGACTECGVVFRQFHKSSTSSYIKRYFLLFLIYLLFIIAACSFGSVVILNQIMKMHPKVIDYYMSAIVFIIVVAIVVIVLVIFKFTIMWTFSSWKIQHGKVFLEPYKVSNSDENRRIVKLRPLPSSSTSEDGFESVPLTEMARNGTDYDNVIEENRNDSEDLTLGQHLFGVYATHHSSSTPIEKPPIAFVFDTQK